MCIQTNTLIKDGRPLGFETDEFYFKSTEEMEELFKEHPESVSNSEIIADKCNFEFDFSEVSENGEDYISIGVIRYNKIG